MVSNVFSLISAPPSPLLYAPAQRLKKLCHSQNSSHPAGRAVFEVFDLNFAGAYSKGDGGAHNRKPLSGPRRSVRRSKEKIFAEKVSSLESLARNRLLHKAENPAFSKEP